MKQKLKPRIEDKKEVDLLRNDCKNLLNSLKTQQNIVLDTFNKFKHNDSINDDESQTFNCIKGYERPTHSFNLKTSELRKSTDSLNSSSGKKRNNSNKTVSFSDYLRTCSTSGKGLILSPRRVSRSASPHHYNAKKSPSKSILKKQLVQDELSDNENEAKNDSQSSSSASLNSMSTNSLLSSNIYGGYFDDIDVFSYRNSNISPNKAGKSSFIEFIAKKRQSYLNYKYNSSSNLNLNNEELFKDTYPIKTSSEDKSIKKATSVDVSHWSRSYSADSVHKSRSKSPSNEIGKKKAANKNVKPTSPARSSSAERRTKSKKLNSIKYRNYKKIAKQMKKNRPLLGYDWALDAIETKLNTTSSKFEKPEEFWNDLTAFRNQNKDDCVSSKQVNFDGSTSTFFDVDSKDLTCYDNQNQADGDDDGRNHKCIHSYTLNDRLFPVPIYKGRNGQSACPVCKSTKKEATVYSPQFCKISIPKSRIMEPIRIEPTKRSNVNPEDTLSLSEHCVAGYQNAPKKGSTMYKLPKSKNLDLKSASGLQNELSKLTITDVKRIASNKDPATSGVYNKGNAMRYDLEDQHLKRLRELIPRS